MSNAPSDFESKLRALALEACQESAGLVSPEWELKKLRTAAAMALEEAAGVIEGDVADHRTNTGHTRDAWCEDYGCSSLMGLAWTIRSMSAALRSAHDQPKAGKR